MSAVRGAERAAPALGAWAEERPRAPRALRTAVGVVQAGMVIAVLAVVPYKAFELDRFFIPKELVLHATAAVAAVLALAGVRRVELTRTDLLLLAYLGVSVLSAIFADNWWLASRALAVSLSSAAIYWVARRGAAHGLGRRIVLAAALAAIVAALTAVLQAYGVESRYVSLNRAPGGTLGNRNFVAHLVVFAVPIVLWCALEARSRLGAALGVAAVAMSAWALVLSRSRAAWLAALLLVPVGAITIVRFRMRWRTERDAVPWRRARTLVGAAVIGAVAAMFLPNTLEWRSDSPYLDSVRGLVNADAGSGHGRIVQYTRSLHMARSDPVLGVGPGNWPVAYPRFAARGDPSLDADGMTANPWPSSDWVAFLSERGVLATALLLLVLTAAGAGGVAAMLAAEDRTRTLAGGALAGALVAAVVVGAFDAFLLLALPSIIVWGTIGALAPPARVRRVWTLTPRASRRLVVGVALAGALITLRSATEIAGMSAYTHAAGIAGLERAARWDPGSYRIRLRLAQAYARRGRCAPAREHALAAQEMYPRSPEPRRVLAVCGARPRRHAPGA
ncbi:MAG TPA: tetratricopeptide repeat protein [Gemmatimonadaceae bacterium]|nr:tetratricopeptide repeat protein [Gemmatimonadaceae bacterium]